MIDKLCDWLVKKMKVSMPELEEERLEIIHYGLENIIGEIPKIFLLFVIAYLLGIGNQTVLLFVLLFPYKATSGGFHLKTHVGCIIGTFLFYYGIVLISQQFVLEQSIQYISMAIVFGFSVIMIKKYAPADTENLPILSKKERKRKKIQSYIWMSITLLFTLLIHNSTIINMLLLGVLMQSFSITRLAYKITKNKYGYEQYTQEESSTITA